MDTKLIMKDLWLKYKKTRDIKYLIKACDIAPFFGNPDMGKKIAELLKQIKK